VPNRDRTFDRNHPANGMRNRTKSHSRGFTNYRLIIVRCEVRSSSKICHSDPLRMNTDTLQRKVLVSLTVTIAFLVASILLVSVPASRFTSPPAREYAAGVARIILAFLVIVLIWRWNRVASALKSPSPRSWA